MSAMGPSCFTNQYYAAMHYPVKAIFIPYGFFTVKVTQGWPGPDYNFFLNIESILLLQSKNWLYK